MLVMHVDASEDGDPQSTVPIAVIEPLARVLGEELEALFPEAAQCEQVELSLSFLSPLEMQAVNRDYRGQDEPTDVLSFPLWEEDGFFAPCSALLELLPLGDILICPEELGCLQEDLPLDEALCLMLAHGFLHLLAWDHDTEAREQIMWERQERLKTKLLNSWRGALDAVALSVDEEGL